MNRTTKLMLAAGVGVVLAGLGYTIAEGEPIMICCPTSGVDCYPVDDAQDCPVEGHFVSECGCPKTQPNGTTTCAC